MRKVQGYRNRTSDLNPFAPLVQAAHKRNRDEALVPIVQLRTWEHIFRYAVDGWSACHWPRNLDRTPYDIKICEIGKAPFRKQKAGLLTLYPTACRECCRGVGQVNQLAASGNATSIPF